MAGRSHETEGNQAGEALLTGHAPAPALTPTDLAGALTPRVAMQLQRSAGNAAVAGLIAGRGTPHARLLQRVPPDQVRSGKDHEQQRQEAMKIVNDECSHIFTAADSNGIAPEAIAGAILWEALENPYNRPLWRLGPGKVHVTERGEKSEAERVEDAHLVPAAKDEAERTARLQTPSWSVTYIAAIMGRHATNYRDIAGVEIGQDVGVLCTLYQGGHSEERARKLAERRKADPNAQPVAADRMAPWVVANLDWIKSRMGCQRAPEPLSTGGQGAA